MHPRGHEVLGRLGTPCRVSWRPEPHGTHHGAHHPANVHGVVAAGAIPVLVPQEFGVCVQQLEADGQDVVLELVQRGEKRCVRSPQCMGALPPPSFLPGSPRCPCKQSCWAHGGHGPPSPSQRPLSDDPHCCYRDEGLALRPAEAQPAKPKGELPPSRRGRILLPAAAAAQGSGTDLTARENHLFPITR